MTAERWAEIDRVFQEASALPPSARAAFLAHRCLDDIELNREVASLLACADGADAFVGACIDDGLRPTWGALGPGTHVGDYRLERLLGSGGMGSVYAAVRADGEFVQQVAIKFSHSLTASDWTAERFRHERRILAQLEHPHIARLLGGGATLQGAPYLVMEYVDGEPLTQWCAVRQTPLRRRLEIFLGVCEAVAHAHRHLVVHRDLKPGNILVTADGSAKLLDFGISKLLDPAQRDDNATTVRLLTPAYASPEQRQGRAVTTATDIYSLGAVLYELISGHTPLPAAEGNRSPALPSSMSGGMCPRGDLDNIVLKAMQPEPARRYETVEQLAADLRAYLAGRPVSARAATWSYRTTRFLARHRLAVGLVCVAALAGTVLAVRWAGDARRTMQFYRELRRLASVQILVLPERVADKSPAEVRAAIGALFDERAQPLLQKYATEPVAAREIAMGYEALGRHLGIGEARPEGRVELGLFYYRRAVAALGPHLESGRIDRHGRAVRARGLCGVARLLERLPGQAAAAREAFHQCLDEHSRGFHHADPAPGAQFVNEYVLAHEWAAEHEWAANRPQGAGRHFAAMVRLARAQTGYDSRAGLWEAAGLAGLARVDPVGAADLLPFAWVRLHAKPLPETIDARLSAARVILACASVDPSLRPVAMEAASALEHDFASNPVATELAARIRATWVTPDPSVAP